MMHPIVDFYELRSTSFEAITEKYGRLGLVFEKPLLGFRIVNSTDGDLLLSLDGKTDQFCVLARSSNNYDLTVRAGNRFLVKYITKPTKGSVYVEGIHS